MLLLLGTTNDTLHRRRRFSFLFVRSLCTPIFFWHGNLPFSAYIRETHGILLCRTFLVIKYALTNQYQQQKSNKNLPPNTHFPPVFTIRRDYNTSSRHRFEQRLQEPTCFFSSSKGVGSTLGNWPELEQSSIVQMEGRELGLAGLITVVVAGRRDQHVATIVFLGLFSISPATSFFAPFCFFSSHSESDIPPDCCVFWSSFTIRLFAALPFLLSPFRFIPKHNTRNIISRMSLTFVVGD